MNVNNGGFGRRDYREKVFEIGEERGEIECPFDWWCLNSSENEGESGW